jgi:hypothetical protein
LCYFQSPFILQQDSESRESDLTTPIALLPISTSSIDNTIDRHHLLSHDEIASEPQDIVPSLVDAEEERSKVEETQSFHDQAIPDGKPKITHSYIKVDLDKKK